MAMCKTCKCSVKDKYLVDGTCPSCVEEIAAGTIQACKKCGKAVSLDSELPYCKNHIAAYACLSCHVKAKQPGFNKCADCSTCPVCNLKIGEHPAGTLICASCKICYVCNLALTGSTLDGKCFSCHKEASKKKCVTCNATLGSGLATKCGMCLLEEAKALASAKAIPAPSILHTPEENAEGWKAKATAAVATKKAHMNEAVKATLAKAAALYAGLPQKVRGILCLPDVFPSSRNLEIRHYRTAAEIQACSWLRWEHVDPVFLRPAPTVPQHGFVDSRPTTTTTAATRKLEAISLLENVLSKDPGGAIIACPYIPARRNAVVTPAGITLGAGHDGATSGKNTITIPLAHTPATVSISPVLLAKAGVKDGDSPYIEAVWPANEVMGHPVITQLRAGPGLTPGMTDYLAKDMHVSKVYEVDPATEDMEGWPAKVKDMASEPGTVVYQAGGSLQCHFGANSKLANMSYFTTFKPAIGQTLTLANMPKPPIASAGAFKRGFIAGIEFDLTADYSKAVAYVLAVTHSIAALDTGEHVAHVGAACALMIRLGIAAALGEMRHKRPLIKAKGKTSKLQRQQIFLHVLTGKGAFLKSFLDFRHKLVTAYSSFSKDAWGSSYGGKAWADCTLKTMRLDQACFDWLHKRGSDNGIGPVGTALHLAVNAAHNNGWWLNKFSSQSLFDQAAAGNLDVVIQSLKYFEAVAYAGATSDKVVAIDSADCILAEYDSSKKQGHAPVVPPTIVTHAQLKTHFGSGGAWHIQYTTNTPSAGYPYHRHDMQPTDAQVALLENADKVEVKSMGSNNKGYFTLTVFPQSNVVGFTIKGTFVPLVSLVP